MKDCFGIFDGEFEVLRVTSQFYDEVEELLVNISVNHEFGCVITNLKDSPLAIAELSDRIRRIISQGISYAIRHVESGRIVAAIANTIFCTQTEHKKEILILRRWHPNKESKYDEIY
ncbi:uncharacterized protein LOC6553009 isoform X3 [Drosophila erecta]|uniref:uncharacterized protein LOC6553009 isoform X3 n=1 Tax=Drosophila erecta TaxID=7220 RepID=UPI000F06AF2A|nr:uncharacterized protein LOC6553009 isoform X3 [Drosophila erecta]